MNFSRKSARPQRSQQNCIGSLHVLQRNSLKSLKGIGFNFKPIYSSLFAISLLALSSCQATNTPSDSAKVDENGRNIAPISENITPFPSVFDVFACKSDNLAFVAAHRGTDASSEYPEDSLIGLQKLVEHGVPFAEIDIAKLKGGPMILFHDGVWNKRATGPKDILAKPLAATTWEESQKLLMKDATHHITATRPGTFADILKFAKDKIYLEIDFKASSKEADVIDAIRKAGMIKQVILISYTPEQALRQYRLAPDAMLSVGIFKPGDIKALQVRGIPVSHMSAWTGKGPLSDKLVWALRKHDIPILAASFLSLNEDKGVSAQDYRKFAVKPDLVVTDVAYRVQNALEFSAKDKAAYQNCLNKRISSAD